jgi:hypothetical protein
VPFIEYPLFRTGVHKLTEKTMDSIILLCILVSSAGIVVGAPILAVTAWKRYKSKKAAVQWTQACARAHERVGARLAEAQEERLYVAEYRAGMGQVCSPDVFAQLAYLDEVARDAHERASRAYLDRFEREAETIGKMAYLDYLANEAKVRAGLFPEP